MVPGSAFLAALADSLHVLSHNPQAATDFRTAGFYGLPHPTLPHEEILILNSVLWSPSYSNCGSDCSDPGTAEIHWLKWMLYEAKIFVLRGPNSKNWRLLFSDYWFSELKSTLIHKASSVVSREIFSTTRQKFATKSNVVLPIGRCKGLDAIENQICHV